jgi:hypothetical protein
MPFRPGQKKPKGSGRKKGQITKDRQMLLDKARELNVDPFEILLHFAAGNHKALGMEETRITGMTASGNAIWTDSIPSEQRVKAAEAAAQYMLPKLKSVDVSVTDDNGNISLTLNLGSPNVAPSKPEPAGTDPAAG